MSKAIAIFATIGVFGMALVGGLAFQSASTPQTPQQLQAKVEQAVARVKPSLPKKVGPNVIWFDIEAGHHKIIYKYEVDVPRRVITSRRSQFEREVRKQMGRMWWARWMLPKGVKLAVHIHDGNRNYVFGFAMTQEGS